jgi:hypothetical protein
MCRLVTVAAGAAAAKFLRYENGAPLVAAQTAYGIEAEVEGYDEAYDPHAMLFMDFRRHHSGVWEGTAPRCVFYVFTFPLRPFILSSTSKHVRRMQVCLCLLLLLYTLFLFVPFPVQIMCCMHVCPSACVRAHSVCLCVHACVYLSTQFILGCSESFCSQLSSLSLKPSRKV